MPAGLLDSYFSSLRFSKCGFSTRIYKILAHIEGFLWGFFAFFQIPFYPNTHPLPPPPFLPCICPADFSFGFSLFFISLYDFYGPIKIFLFYLIIFKSKSRKITELISKSNNKNNNNINIINWLHLRQWKP